MRTTTTDIQTPADGALLRAFIGGDKAALGRLAARYERAMLGYAIGMVRDEGRARDCVQETWVRVIRHAGTFKGRSSVKTWLYRILINRCRESIKSKLRRSSIESSAGGPTAPTDTTADLEARDLMSRVNEALERLEPGRREVVLLCHHRSMTHPEAAAALGVPLGTVKTRLYAAMDELRALVGIEPEVDDG